MPRIREKCEFVRKDGRRCNANPMAHSRYCFFHSPDTANERTAARRAGGIQRCRPPAVLPAKTPDWPIRSASDLLGLLSDTASRVRRGELDYRIATAVGSLSSVMLQVLRVGEIEERLAALETVIEQSRQPIQLGSGHNLADSALRLKND